MIFKGAFQAKPFYESARRAGNAAPFTKGLFSTLQINPAVRSRGNP